MQAEGWMDVLQFGQDSGPWRSFLILFSTEITSGSSEGETVGLGDFVTVLSMS